MAKDIKIPEIGEKVESGKVVGVLVSKGDMVDVDDGIIEFETDKAVVEIPSPEKGKITEILVSEGDELKIGDVVARVDTEGKAGEADDSDEEEEKDAKAEDEESGEKDKEEGKEEIEEEEHGEEEDREEEEKEPKKEKEKKTAKKEQPANTEPQKKDAAEKRSPAPASPSVRRLARELGININAVKGSGPGGRITDADVKDYVKGSRTAASSATSSSASDLPDFSRWGEIDEQDLSSVRRVIAEGTTASWRTVPHVTQFDKADITTLESYLKQNAKKAEKEGGKLTITAVLMKICAEALQKFPRFNASLDLENRKLILKKYIHFGMAVDTEAGLLVPVIRDVDQKTVIDLAVEIVDIAKRTRSRKIKPEEMEGGTFSISNQGSIGGTDFTPIVLWPQAAILGVSRASTEPKYIDGEVRPRTILPLSLSYDHRIIDGADAARFLRWVCEALEYPAATLLE